MKKKDLRTIEYYMIPGAEIRLMETICTDLIDKTNLCPKYRTSKIQRLLREIIEVGNHLYSQMIRDNWLHTDERHSSMFHGMINKPETDNEVDKAIIQLAKAITEEMFKNDEED